MTFDATKRLRQRAKLSLNGKSERPAVPPRSTSDAILENLGDLGDLGQPEYEPEAEKLDQEQSQPEPGRRSRRKGSSSGESSKASSKASSSSGSGSGSRSARSQNREAGKPLKTSIHLDRERGLDIKVLCTRHQISYATYLEAAHEVLAKHPKVLDAVIDLAQRLSDERREQ